jgi:hypothetical protein
MKLSNLIVVFCLGALMLYYLFYRSKLIPRWISGWGFIAILIHPTTGFLIFVPSHKCFFYNQVVVDLPIGLQEMVMAIWLIVKGFNSFSIASGFAEADMSQG